MGQINRHGDKTDFHRGHMKTRGHKVKTGSNRTGDRLPWKQKLELETERLTNMETRPRKEKLKLRPDETRANDMLHTSLQHIMDLKDGSGFLRMGYCQLFHL